MFLTSVRNVLDKCAVMFNNESMTKHVSIKFKTDKNGKRFAMKQVRVGMRGRWVRCNMDEANMLIATGQAAFVSSDTPSIAAILNGTATGTNW